ncbi:hypothetical protein MTR67_007871 [Solanum verrucosum]|uniref:Uncharacterized protein n=1 Tax=Solanum verrucosum TaxID=315347 RepID=A0AAF0Q5U1_SOLVR|nr:hypothetical protein MTR67_007871 [Solanum verrucosum]
MIARTVLSTATIPFSPNHSSDSSDNSKKERNEAFLLPLFSLSTVIRSTWSGGIVREHIHNVEEVGYLEDKNDELVELLRVSLGFESYN